uniref:DOMON domain-containing protein n=2 Tax=Caenorhabditis japonica TaxID=281687 RepID=A0A8R1I0M3_CAEJA
MKMWVGGGRSFGGRKQWAGRGRVWHFGTRVVEKMMVSWLPRVLIIILAARSTVQRSVPQNTSCSYHSSNYSISWTYDEVSNDVVFTLVARPAFTNFYTAVGFGAQEPEDVIAVYVRSQQIGLIDGHLADDGAIESDEKTNVQALQFDLQKDTLTAKFARPVETFDMQDSDLGSCITMFLLTESREIITGLPMELGDVQNLQKIRVCDIAVTCSSKMNNDVLVKRQEEAPICATGPESQKNRIEWNVDGDLVHFTVAQNAKKGRWWTAFGVGESMRDLTMILLFAEAGRLRKQGIFRTEGKMQPMEVQYEGIDVKKDMAVVNNGKANFDLTIEKKFFTDRADENGCFTLQVAILAGQYQPNFNIQKHQNTPEAIRVCNLDGCTLPTIAPQNVDGNTETETEADAEAVAKVDAEATPEKEPENVVEAEASGDFVTKSSADNDVEGSGLPVEPKFTLTTPPKTGEEADERPLTGDDAPVEQATSPSSSSSTSAETVKNSTLSSMPPVFIVDNKTEEKAEEKTPIPDENPAETTPKTKNTGCGAEHEDLKICESYFGDYLGKVQEWSDKHNMTVTSHMWKACTLLSQVQHVTTMCCTIFRNTCSMHLGL